MSWFHFRIIITVKVSVLYHSSPHHAGIFHMNNSSCGDLNENGPHRRICSNAWSQVDKTVWEVLKSVALLEEMLCQRCVTGSGL